MRLREIFDKDPFHFHRFDNSEGASRNEGVMKSILKSDASLKTSQFWSQAATPSFSALLQKCKYSPKLQAYYLALFQHVISHFPDPNSSHKTKLNGDGTPYDISWNDDSSTSNSTVRFSYDLFGPPRKLIKELEALGFLKGGGADLTLLDDTMKWFLDEAYDVEHPPYLFSAIDCGKNGDSLYKVYFRPAINNARALCHQRGAELVQHWDESFFGGGLKEAFGVVGKFNEDYPLERQQTIHMLAWDCMKPGMGSRIKLYMYYSYTSLQAVRDMWTQRGQLEGKGIELGLKCIEELWSLLYEDKKKLVEDEELKNKDGRRQTICLNLEMRPGDKQPAPKMYFQPWLFGKKSDVEIAVALQGWFRKWGLGGLGENYVDDLKEIL